MSEGMVVDSDVMALVLAAKGGMENLMAGPNGAVYRNNPEFMRVAELVECAAAFGGNEE